ncbi:MAG: response regulator [Verrucomicrobia bacterium]|nr:response regulator [Verrucomicrobiota bacterium]
MKKLLFIEDDTIVGKMYQHALQSAGFQVELVGDGKAGLAAREKLEPDLVILDLMLPKVSGVQILTHLRAQAATKSLPVIVLTNAYLSQMVEEAERSGANLCLIKAETPPARLAEAVRRIFANQEAVAAGFPPAAPVNLPKAAVFSDVHGATARLDPNEAFWRNAPHAANRMRGLARELVKIDETPSQLLLIGDMCRSTHSLAGTATVVGATAVTRMATAMEAMLKELESTPSKISSSTSRTVGQACEFLGELLDHRNALPVMKPSPAYRALVVDDDPLTLQAVNHALKRAEFKCQCVEDPFAAYQFFTENAFDLAIIDVQMPGMEGFELCQKIHAVPGRRIIPVLFLTRLNDFEHRVRSAMSGGAEFIAKPFLFMELTVKALMHVMRRHLMIRPTRDESFRPLADR